MSGYSNSSLQKKLGIKEGMIIFLQNAPDEYLDWVSPLPMNVQIKSSLTGEVDFIHIFHQEEKLFKKEFVRCKRHLDRNSMLWVSWPKKASKIQTDLDENIIREFGLHEGLVDVKVCAVSEVWSGLKFVFRLKDR